MTASIFPLFFMALIGILGSVVCVDLRYRKITNIQNLLLLAVGLLFGLFVKNDVASAAMGAIAGGVILFGIRQVHLSLRGQDGIGFGDIKFMIGAGAWVGWDGIAPLLLIASILALLAVGAGTLVTGDTLKIGHKLAFGPFLALALLTVFLLHEWQVAPWIPS
ncbi:MAG: A24 family peptidase [Beijerinckiaceae bacterium]|nr:A24 family peptidase [Beijerinckiaceae bacterium]MCZ8298992.1 A24 family peptidase [Beijerinckiaceae bacterium]